MKKLIVNADDLGLSVAVSRGIEKGHREGLVSSATIMANMPGFEEGVRVAKDNPDLGIGIHLNLIRGMPLSEPEKVSALLASGGNFIDRFYQLGRVSATEDYLTAAEYEYRAQIEKVMEQGITPDHLDFEKHHGIWRGLYELGQKLAEEYNLAIRSYREPIFFVWRNLPPAGLRPMWKSLHMFIYQFFKHKKPDVPAPDYFFGQSHIGTLSREYIKSLVTNLPDGVSELMCHPGLRDGAEEDGVSDAIGESWITNCRVSDLAAIADPEVVDYVKNLDVEIGTFADFLKKNN